MTETVVIGAGLSGLAHGYALARRGHDVLVVESSDRAGGVVRTVSAEGFLLELGPNTVRPTAELWTLVRDLGLAPEALLSDPRLPRWIEHRGRLHRVSPAALWTTSLLSWGGKFRLLGEPFVGSRGRRGESARDFFARRLGTEAADRLVAPFISGVWAGDAAVLSAEAAFPAAVGWERESGNLLSGALAARRKRPALASGGQAPRGLLSFRDGLESLPRALQKALGERLRLGSPALRLEAEGGHWRVTTDRDRIVAGNVVVAAPAKEAARLVAPFEPEAAEALSTIPHPPLAVLHLDWPSASFDVPLRGFGHLAVPDPGKTILGAVWSSSLFPGRAPADRTLLTAFAGGARSPEAATLSDSDLLDRVAGELGRVLGARGLPRLLRVTRYPRAIPQYDLDHDRRLEALARAEARQPTLRFLGNFRGGISVADVVKNALAVPENGD